MSAKSGRTAALKHWLRTRKKAPLKAMRANEPRARGNPNGGHVAKGSKGARKRARRALCREVQRRRLEAHVAVPRYRAVKLPWRVERERKRQLRFAGKKP